MAGSFLFEVRVQREKRWIVDRVLDNEAEALAHAKDLARVGSSEAVQVERSREYADGTITSVVIFNQACDPRKDPVVTIVPIEDAADCASVEDLYGVQARLTMWKVLRKYFDQVVLSPIEVLHNYNALSKLMDNDPPVYPAAVDRIASIQARKMGIASRERRDELYRWMDEVASRAREAERERAMWKHSLDNYPALAQAALDWAGPQRRDHLIRCTISRQFYTTRNWLAKLQALLKAINPDLPPEDVALLGGFVADILGSANVIQDILGTRSNLGDAMLGLLDLMEGKEETRAIKDVPEVTTTLRTLFSRGHLREGTAVLVERVKTQVGGRQPLNRANPEKETETFSVLMSRLNGPQGIIGGASMADALTTRCALQFEQGGMTGRKMAVSAMITLIRDPLQKIRYLLSLVDTETGQHTMDIITLTIDGIVAAATDVHNFVNPTLPALKKMAAISDVMRLTKASNLPEESRCRLFGRLDDLLADFVERDGFVARLDDEALSLRDRATRLVRFCSSGVLVEGKALTQARKRIATHLRQPHFVEKYTEGCANAAEADKLIRAFYAELEGAGFKG